ncbi:MAG: hypothetical protein IPI46_00615 [Bacteroidetes bacterium]|nr:hypothetical protein [Bacteroidota bacterium]
MKKILSLISLLFLVYFSEAQAPIAYYPFSGNAGDSSGSANHGTVNGATLTTDRFGNANSAYAFDGVDDVISTTSLATNQATNWTMTAWVKPANLTNSDRIIVQNGGDGTGFPCNGYSLGMNTNQIYGYHPCVAFIQGNSTFPVANQWYHIAMVNDGTVTKFYINGILASGTSSTTPIMPNGILTIGSSSGIRFFQGAIDEVKIYNSALTTAQIQQSLDPIALPIAVTAGGTNAGCGSINANNMNGSSATGLGCGGGGAGYFGGFGGNGYLGGGGGGAAGFTAANRKGGDGGSGFVLVSYFNTNNAYVNSSVYNSGTSFVIPAGIGSVKVWAIGAGGGGAGATSSDGTCGGGGGAGGVAFKTFSVNAGDIISYTIGVGGAGGVDANDGQAGTATTVTFNANVVTGNGGSGGAYNIFIDAAGGTFSGGDGGANGGSGKGAAGDNGGGAGGGIGGGLNNTISCAGGDGANSINVVGLFAAVTNQIAPGLMNNNVKLNGANDYMLVPHNAVFNSTSEITVEAWVYPTSYPSQYPAIIAKHNANSSFELDLKNDNTIEWECMIDGVQRNLNGGTITLNQWTHIAATYNGSTMKIFKNGIVVASFAVTGAIGTNSFPVEIGSRSGGGAVFAGKMDEVRVWNIARTQSQIVNAMNAELLGNETGLVGYWDMNRNGEGAGLIVNNKATLTGSSLNAITFGTANTPIFLSTSGKVLKPGSGNALTFDGADDFVEMPNVLHGLTQTTIEFWVKTTENRTSGLFWQKPTLIGNANPSAPDGDFGITTNNGEIGIWSGLCTCGDQSLQTTKAINDNQWHHVAAINDATTIKLYVDGIELGSIPSTGGIGFNVNGRPLFLGASNSCCSGINAHAGSIDEIRFWNIALTENQLRERMCRKITSNDTLYDNLQTYFNADENSNINLFDGSENGNHKTLQGGVVRETSGAPIGNTSLHNYVSTGFPAINLSVNALDNLHVTYTAGSYSGIAGTHIYSVNEKPNSENGITVLGANDNYFGVFNANLTAPQYTATYNYTGNANVSSNLENFVSLYKRDDNASTAWTNSNATLNTVSNTLTVTGQSTEYMLGLNSSNQVLKPGSGNAISFDGVDDHITTSAYLVPTTGDFTVDFWVINRNNAGFREFISQGSSGNAFYIGLDVSGTGNMRCGDLWQNTNAILPLNKWTHVTMTKFGSNATLYLNGIQVATKTGYSISAAGTNTLIGRQYGGITEFPDASLDEIRIWNSALTESQIRDRMCRKITSTDALYANLVAYYNFDESTGNTTFDGSVMNNNGTLVNNPTRVLSGAAIGNTSTHNYVTTGLPSANLSANAQDNLAVAYTSGTYTGTAATQLYAVTEKPNSEIGINAISTNNTYFGVFNVNLNSPNYSATYNYTGSTAIDGTNENNVALYKRNDNGITTWTDALATLNSNANTLSVTGQNTEYMLGLITVTPFSPTNVLVNDGTATFATTPNGMLHGLTTFTAETWIKTTENKTSSNFFDKPTIIGNARSSVNDGDFGVYTSGGIIGFWCGFGNENFLTTTTSINDNQWHHVAVVREATSFKLFVDGIQLGSLPCSSSIGLQTNFEPLSIGASSDFAWPGSNAVKVNFFHQGEFAETRFSNTARYSSNFIPSNSFTTDASTVALYHYGTCQREQCVDASGNNHFLQGRFLSPTCASALPFNSAITYDGINQGAILPANLMNGLTNFTIEGWMKSTDVTTSPTSEMWRAPWIFGKEMPSGNSGDIMITTQAGYLNFSEEFVGGQGYTESLTKYFISDNQWHHIAVSADGIFCRFFVDGILLGSKPVDAGLQVSASDQFVLMNRANTNESSHSGMLDEVRLSNTARYITNFIPPTSIFTSDVNTLALYHSDDCSNVSLFDSSSNNNHATFQNMIINCGGGIISANQSSCFIITPNPLIGTPAFGNEPTIVYQWQDSIVGGIWTNISGATNATSYAPPTLTTPTYYRRLATLSSSTLASNIVFLDIRGAISPAIIPINSWNVYAYNGTDLNLGAGTTYQGYYTVSGLVVNSESLWNANAAPSTAPGYKGCIVNQAPWTIAAKRQGFTPDNYILNITSVDNGVRAYLDGNEIFAAGGFGPYPNITLGALNANSVIEVRAENSGGPGYLNFNLQTSALQGGTIGSNQTSCESFMPALLTNSAIAFGGSLLTMSYQWQESMDDVNYTDIVGATSLSYQPDSVFADKYFRRKVTNANNEMAFSNAVFMDINGPVFYADADGDGFGDINNTIQACSVPMGYVVNNTDCNDNDSIQKPGQIWYLDADNDGYKAFIATMTQCTRPVNRKAFSELLSNQGDCNDNNNHIHPGAQYLNFTGANNYVSNICNPLIGDAFTNFRYEVNYFNIYNEMPENGAPRLSVDLGQNFIVEANDKRLSMQQDDVNDLNTMDGKKYFLIVNGIQPGIPLQSYVSPHLLTCDYLGPFLNEPEVVNYPNLSVAAKDISFSNYNPDVSTTITVEVVVQNNSSFDAINIPVRLVNQFDTTQFFPIQTIPFIAKNDVASVTWTITTPPISALCPMKVMVDYGNTLNETNENDNTAIRGFVNGNGSISGGIAVTSSVTPKTVLVGAGNPGQATLTGNAQYTGLALALNNASVPGAEVFCTIVETGQTFQGTTDANGDFSIPFAVPIGAGTYHISGTVYDFTWAGVMNASTNDFTVVPALGQPDLVPMVSFESSNPLLAGNKIKAKYYSYNFGFIPTTANHTCKLTIIGPSGYLFEDSTLIASLNNGTASAEVSIETPILNAIGTYFVTVTTDLNDSIIESGESNNSITIPIEVIPEQVDLISGSASASGGNIICNNQLTVQTFVKNNGSIATSSGHTALMNLKQGNTVVGTQTFLVPVLQSKEELILTHTFTIPYSPNSYVVEVTADINNIVLESNETNNTMATILNIDTCKADLQLADFCNKVEIVATNNNYTAPVTLKAIITNKGSHTITQPVKVRFTFDNNAFFDYIHNSPIAPLDIINVSLPNVTLPAGATTMIVEIDPLNTIEEITNSNNNSDVKNLGLDFAPSLAGCITPMSNFIVYTGGLVNLRSSIRSNNLYGVDSVKTSFSISGPGIIGIQHLGSVYLYNVSPTCFCPQVATLPTVYLISQPGTYQIYIKSDPDNDIAESDETNNELVISLTTQDVPDMMMHTTFINPSNLNPAAGQGITTQVSYKNLGVGNVGDTMKLKLMIDNVAIDSVVNATGLPSNGTATYAFNTPWSSVQPGVHLIKAIIDDGNAITESNETNNMAVRAIIVGDAANMYFDSLGSLNLYPQLGDSAIIYADIGNNGTLGCTSLLTFYFLNDFNDTLLIRNYTMSVAPNGHQIITFKWKVIDEKTVVVAKLTNSTVQEFDYADNTATFAFGQMKLITEAFPACNPNNIGSITAHILGGSPPFTYAWSNNTTSATMQDVSGNYSVTVFDQSGQQVSGSDSIPVCNGFLLHAKCILQGFYDGNGIMNPVLTQSGIISPLAFTDTVTVNLHSTSFGFPMVASSQAILHTNGSIVCELPSSEIGNNRYIVIKHRNSFETWSANPITISAITNYDFTTSASQAFGDNQVEVENGIWAMFTGDINQDGNADLLDASMLEASMANFDFGYFVTDLNGDGNVDLLDSPVLEVNVNNFVFSNHP